MATLISVVTTWVAERGDGGAPISLGSRRPGGTVSSCLKGGCKEGSSETDYTNSAILERLNLLVDQVKVIATRQDALEKAASSKPSAKDAGESPAGRSVRFPALSDGLNSGVGPPLSAPKVLEMVGPPPKTQLHRTVSTP